jgi:hypothetical protein
MIHNNKTRNVGIAFTAVAPQREKRVGLYTDGHNVRGSDVY